MLHFKHKNYEKMKRGELWQEAKERCVQTPAGMVFMRQVYPDPVGEEARRQLIAELNAIDDRRMKIYKLLIALASLIISFISIIFI